MRICVGGGQLGIGATFTIERYVKQHAGPFRAAFSDRHKRSINAAWQKVIMADILMAQFHRNNDWSLHGHACNGIVWRIQGHRHLPARCGQTC